MASFVNQLTTPVQLFQKSMLSSTNMESTFSALFLDNGQPDLEFLFHPPNYLVRNISPVNLETADVFSINVSCIELQAAAFPSDQAET